MRTHFLFLMSCFFLVIGNPLFAQLETVEFSYQKASFNNDQPLPSEAYLRFTGPVRPEVNLVEISVYRGTHKVGTESLYTANWKRAQDDNAKTFTVTFPYKLRGNAEYDFSVSYFRDVNPAEKTLLEAELSHALEAYLGQIFSGNDKKIKLRTSPSQVLEDLNQIVVEGMTYYRSKSNVTFNGFSDIVKGQLRTVNKNDGIVMADSSNTNVYKKHQLDLLNLVKHEASQILHEGLLVKMDERKVLEYPTEKGRSQLALNIGYGGVYLDGKLDDISYDASPYLGISLPLGNRIFASPILSNTSLSLGVFTQNFENRAGDKVTGPIFGRPYYAALGYSFFRFLRLNAGATLIQTDAVGGGIGVDVNAVDVVPFIGLSAEIDIWLGFREKK